MPQKDSFKIIVTLGPSILDEEKLKRINSQGECIYRINGAHADREQAERLIAQVKDVLPDAKIMMDLPGNKIRTANLPEPIRLVKGEHFSLHDYEVNFPEFKKYLNKGDVILANDSTFTFEVEEIMRSSLKLLSHSDGLLFSNKGLNAKGVCKNIPFIFDRDRELIDLACSSGVDYVSLSFVRDAGDVRYVKKIIENKDIHIIAKIETLSAIHNLDSILDEVGSILIDRGDLSTEVGILGLAQAQEEIIESAQKKDKKIYLATHFLKNMETKPIPLISEVIDLMRTLKVGITGIQLSEETAIGKYPVECVKLVFDAFKKSEV